MDQNELEFNEQQLSLNDYLRILYRGRWIILISFLVVFLFTLYYTMTATPVYESTTSVIIDRNGAMERTFYDMGGFGGQNTTIANQLEIIRSRSLSERVVKRLDLSDVRDSLALFQPNSQGEYLTMRGMIGVIKSSMDVSHKKETDIIQITYQASTPFESAYIANTIADEFQYANAEASRGEISDLRKFLETQLSKKGEELRLSEERLRDYQEREKVASLDDETSGLVGRLSGVESMLEQAQVELQAKLEMKSSLAKQLDERKQTLSTDLSEISTPYLSSLQQELASIVAERTKYTTAIEIEVQDVNKRHFEANIKQYDDKIKAMKQKLEEEARKISTSSMVKDPFQISQDLVTQLLTSDAEIKTLTAKISALQDVVNEYNRKMEILPEKVLELARLERRRMVDEQTYIMMTQKMEETKIQEAGQRNEVRIIDEAIEPYAPVKPKKKMNLMLGALIGLGLGIGLIFLVEYFDNTIKTHEDIERMGLNILGTIPTIATDKVEKKMESKLSRLGPIEGKKIEARLIAHFDPKSPVSEAYRTLRTNLQFSKIDEKLKTILVTSSGPKEGKSTTAANLAIAMAQSGNRVVLVDADLRRPVVHSIFGQEKDSGVTNYLMDAIPYEELAKTTPINNLFIITSGILPPNPSELISSHKMEGLLERLKEDFDIILFDSPPVIAVTDAAILSTKVDGVIIIVSSGQTNRDALLRSQSLLDNVGARILGFLLNNVDVEGTYGSYYYYYYHNYYSKPGKKMKTKKPGVFSR
ncbi:MAG: GumC family protein [Calditrichaceae bacterium]